MEEEKEIKVPVVEEPTEDFGTHISLGEFVPRWKRH